MISHVDDWNSDVVPHVSAGAGGLGLISWLVHFGIKSTCLTRLHE